MATRFVMHADRQWRVASRRILSVCNWIEIVELVTHAGLLEWVAGCWNPAGAGSLRYRGRAQGRGSVGVVSAERGALSFIAAALHFGLERRPAGVEVFPAAPCEEHGADGAGEGDGVELVAQGPSEQGEEQADGDSAEEGQGQVAHYSVSCSLLGSAGEGAGLTGGVMGGMPTAMAAKKSWSVTAGRL